jgi:hypothetical protein
MEKGFRCSRLGAGAASEGEAIFYDVWNKQERQRDIATPGASPANIRKEIRGGRPAWPGFVIDGIKSWYLKATVGLRACLMWKLQTTIETLTDAYASVMILQAQNIISKSRTQGPTAMADGSF